MDGRPDFHNFNTVVTFSQSFCFFAVDSFFGRAVEPLTIMEIRNLSLCRLFLYVSVLDLSWFLQGTNKSGSRQEETRGRGDGNESGVITGSTNSWNVASHSFKVTMWQDPESPRVFVCLPAEPAGPIPVWSLPRAGL